MALELIRIENQPVNSNCYILFDKEINGYCLIVDPGSENSSLLNVYLNELNLIPEYILLTHEHFDHIWGCNFLIEKYNAKIICSSECSLAINDSKKNCSLYYDQVGFIVPPADICIEKNTFDLLWNNYAIHFFIAKGHTRSGICFLIQHLMFTGDSLIKGLKTVTKLLTGSVEDLRVTISNINSYKGKGYIICPGHGEMFDLDKYNLEKAFV